MKKFLTMIVALTLMLTSAAVAENVPTPQFGKLTETEQTTPVEEQAESVVPTMEPVNYSIPSGQRVFPYTMIEAGSYSGFMIRDWEFADAVQAEEPAEHSLTYTALPGTKLLHIRFVTRYWGTDAGRKDVKVDRVQGTVIDGTQKTYLTSAFMEGSENTISYDACLHTTLDCTTHPNSYMMPLSGTTKVFELWNGATCYALCDFIAEIPEELVGTVMPLYLMIKLPKDTETEYYIQLQ